MKYYVNEVEEYVIRNVEYIDLIVEQVCLLLPNRYFYKPEIEQGELLLLRREMKELENKIHSLAYSKDKYVKREFFLKQKEYDSQLLQLVVQKRQQLLDELLEETLEMKMACVISLVVEHKLMKMLRSFC